MVCRSQSLVVIFDDTPPEGQKTVEFRLVYSGRVLGASRNNTRPELKHEIRREFHPQLQRLWQTNESLREVVRRVGSHAHDKEYRDRLGPTFNTFEPEFPPEFPLHHDDPQIDSFHHAYGADLIADKWERAGFRFWPLVTEEYCIKCSLDILFLRPEEPGLLIRSGDIDARIKTIFDALRMPTNRDETGAMGPQTGENPFFCLLEDDKLISEVKVTTDQLLLLPKEREIKANDALLVIHVKLWPTHNSPWDWAFF